MSYRKLKADQIFDGEKLHNDKVLIITTEGVVVDVVEIHKASEEVEIFSGVITPGFINCHCHLELSHLKNTVAACEGLVNFLISVVQNRKLDHPEKLKAIEEAEKEMFENGIVGVADICNTTDAIDVKSRSKIKWHNLVEMLNLHDKNLEKQLAHSKSIVHQHQEKNLEAVLTAHAPYSISEATFKAINENTAGKIISVHNQETAAENELFLAGGGEFLKLYSTLGNESLPMQTTGKTSLQSWLKYFTEGQTILLVHNTFISEEDIVFATAHADKYGLKLVYCLCPNANLYIEEKLPPVDLLLKYNCTIALGTDSYCSNWQLSIASEMKTLMEKVTNLSFETCLKWATSNGAKALGWDEHLGSFEKGKKPGVVLLNTINFSLKRII